MIQQTLYYSKEQEPEVDAFIAHMRAEDKKRKMAAKAFAEKMAQKLPTLYGGFAEPSPFDTPCENEDGCQDKATCQAEAGCDKECPEDDCDPADCFAESIADGIEDDDLLNTLTADYRTGVNEDDGDITFTITGLPGAAARSISADLARLNHRLGRQLAARIRDNA